MPRDVVAPPNLGQDDAHVCLYSKRVAVHREQWLMDSLTQKSSSHVAWQLLEELLRRDDVAPLLEIITAVTAACSDGRLLPSSPPVLAISG